MRALVIGGSGFIGSHLVDRLVGDGYKVRVLGRSPLGSYPYRDADRVEYVVGDFSSHATNEVALKDIDVAFHLLSTTIPATSNADMNFDIQSNIGGTVSFLKAAVSFGLKKVIFVSSGGTVYGKPEAVPIKETARTEPICSYGITKLAIEKYFHLYELLHGLDHLVFRLSNPFGERQRPGAQGAIAAFMHKVLQDQPIEIWGDGMVVRDYIYIGNVVDALMQGIAYSGKQRIFNLGSGQGRNLIDLIETIERFTGRQVERRYLPGRVIDVPNNTLDISLIKKEMGWEPKIGFEDGIKTTWKWIGAGSQKGRS